MFGPNAVQVRALLCGIIVLVAVSSAFAAQHLTHAIPASTANALLERVPSDLVRVRQNSAEQTVSITLGPVQLKAGGSLRVPIQMVALPVSGWLQGYEWSVRGAKGERLSADLLHHINLIDPDRRELFAPIARRVVASGRETGPQKLPRILGYPVAPNTRFLMVTMLHNGTAADVPEAYVNVELRYTQRQRFRPIGVAPFYLDVMGPVGDRDFPVPPGHSTKVWEGTPALDVRVLGIGGHVHEFARALQLQNAATGRVLWQADLKPDREGRLEVPTNYLLWKGGLKLKSGTPYRVSIDYFNPARAPAAQGGMGVIGGIVSANFEHWPALDPNHPTYIEDLRNVLTAPERARMQPGSHHH
jgi:hypothetical protein